MGSFGLLGEHLGHSMSPQIHAELGDYPYPMYEVAPEDFPAFMEKRDFDALNVTIPYKKAVMPYCAKVSHAVERVGSVNTLLKQPDGSLYGENTDYYGFLYTLQHHKVVIAGKKALVLGSGGASLAVRAVLEDRGAAQVITVSRSGENNYQNLHLHKDADILINATPVGMYPNNGVSPVDLTIFDKLAFVGDLIYNPLRTALLQQAEGLGIPCANGLMMLAAQAKQGCELFLGQPRTDAHIARCIAATQRALQNVVLIGMPGSGKSTVGEAVAKALGQKLIDTDEEIIARSGKSIPQIFAQQGETEFRKIESAVVADVGRRNGIVLATGGGAVLKEENRAALRQNGVIFFLNRNIHLLATEGRPLSKDTAAVQQLYNTRLPVYRALCDYEIDANAPIEQVAQQILEVLK